MHNHFKKMCNPRLNAHNISRGITGLKFKVVNTEEEHKHGNWRRHMNKTASDS